MFRSIMCIMIFLIITGCQSNNLEEVINEHNNIKNIEGLNEFVEDVQNQNEAEINYVQYGIEGQRGVRKLTFLIVLMENLSRNISVKIL